MLSLHSRLSLLVAGLLTASLVGSAVAAVPESAPFTLPTLDLALDLPAAPPPPPRALPQLPRVPVSGTDLLHRALTMTAKPCPGTRPERRQAVRLTAARPQASASVVSGGISTAS